MVVRLVIAAVLVAASEALRRAETIERRLADVQLQLTTLTVPSTLAAYDEVEHALAFATRLPLVGQSLRADVRTLRAAASYWRADYAALTSVPRSPDAPDNAAILFLTANASYRSAFLGRQDRATRLRALDAALQRYADVLTAAPGYGDAAYNYEFVVRLRNTVARGQDDLAAGVEPNMHGDEGRPPEGTKTEEFNVIVPLRPEERREQLDAGDSVTGTRKG